MNTSNKPQTITIKQTDYEYLKYLIETLAADLPYNQTAQRALKTIKQSGVNSENI